MKNDTKDEKNLDVLQQNNNLAIMPSFLNFVPVLVRVRPLLTIDIM